MGALEQYDPARSAERAPEGRANRGALPGLDLMVYNDFIHLCKAALHLALDPRLPCLQLTRSRYLIHPPIYKSKKTSHVSAP